MNEDAARRGAARRGGGGVYARVAVHLSIRDSFSVEMQLTK